MSQRVIAMVNRRILAQLEQGVIPWKMPWQKIGPPRNLVSGKTYRGLNLLLLSHNGFSSPYFLTFNQARSFGGHVAKGAVGFPVTFWGWVEHKQELGTDEKKARYPLLRSYTVFNLDQCVGIKADEHEGAPEITPLKRAEQIISGMPIPPNLTHVGDQACYRWLSDEVLLPPRRRFLSPEEYYATAFHELVHATGHRKRIGREGIEAFDGFASEHYGKEELIAEMGAAYLCALSGISHATVGNNAAYIQGWLQALKYDPRLLLQASSAAQKAVEFIAGESFEGATNDSFACSPTGNVRGG